MRRQHGFGIVIHKSLDIVRQYLTPVRKTDMYRHIVVSVCKIRTISAYTRTEKNVSENENFYRGLVFFVLGRQNWINGNFNITSRIFERHSYFDGKSASLFETGASDINGKVLLIFVIQTKWLDHPTKPQIK